MDLRLIALREAVEKTWHQMDGVIGLKRGPADSIAPHLFQKERPEELADLALWPKYPLPDTLRLLQKAHKHAKLALVCRGCEERGLVEMGKRAQINLANVTLIGLQCVAGEAGFCRCAKPYTVHASITVGEPIEGAPDPLTEEFAAKSQSEKLAFWKRQFLCCIKCYGCRNVCPQCFCNVCVLEDEKWVSTGWLPMPLPPMYHLIRAMHMAAKCAACRECEETCPVGIPLSIHYRLIARDVKEMFGYETGASLEEKPPQLLTLAEGEFERTGLPR